MEFCAILQQWPSGVSEGDFGGVVPQGDVTFNRVAVRISSNEFQDIKVHPAFPVIKSGQTEDTYLNIVHNAAALFHYFQIWLVVFIKIDPGKVLLIRNHSSLFEDRGRWALWFLFATCHDTANKDGSQWQ